MSEYQYYEFRAVDRLLDEDDRRALRALSSRASITPTRFTNEYHWGDFRGDPAALVARWFDLHLYLANWGTRRLMIRLPSRLADASRFASIVGPAEGVTLDVVGEHLVLDIVVEEVDGPYWEIADEDEPPSRWLDALEPLRADLLRGDLRLLYLLWLGAVESELVPPDDVEPLPGAGPASDALVAFADFFAIDRDLVAAAAEREDPAASVGAAAVEEIVAALSAEERAALLLRVARGDPHVGAELDAAARSRLTARESEAPGPRRTAAELRARAEEIRRDREAAAAARAAAEKRRRAEAEAAARRSRVAVLAARGDDVWREVEMEIERRNPAGYERAIGLIQDLEVVAAERGGSDAFARRIAALRDRHARKQRFVERLDGVLPAAGRGPSSPRPGDGSA